MTRRVLALLLLAAVALAGCSSGDGRDADGRLTVTATTTHVADFVRNVGRERVDVHAILRANADPHDYEPRPSDARALTDSAVVFRSGGEVDEWLGDLLDNAGGDATEVDLIDSVRRRGDDPHWWQDPRNAELAVGSIRDALIEADPDGRAAYTRNAAAYTTKLRDLDAGIAACLRQVPRERRTLVTTHDSLAYFADRYGVRVVGAVIPSLSTQAQPSARDVQRLVDQIRAERVKAIFPETAVNQRLERAIARESGATIGEPLWGDTLGEPGSTGATYLRAMAFNADAIVRGMTGGRADCTLRGWTRYAPLDEP